MAGRIRGGRVTAQGGTITGVANIDWQDSVEFDRSQADSEMSGDPVEMKRAGSGTIELLAGDLPSGYGTSNLSIAYDEITVTAGVEAKVEKTVTFNKVTFNSGGNVPAGAAGRRKVSFDYGEHPTT